jgi:hypothetical protein
MTFTLQNSTYDQREELSAPTGRFGRQVRTIAWPDPDDLAPVRSDLVLEMKARVQYFDYKIDNRVLAEAIIARVRRR